MSVTLTNLNFLPKVMPTYIGNKNGQNECETFRHLHYLGIGTGFYNIYNIGIHTVLYVWNYISKTYPRVKE